MEIVRSLIQAGANSKCSITQAVKKQNYDILNLLEEKNVDIADYINNHDYMPLFYAYGNTDVKMVKYLIKKGVKVEKNFNELMFNQIINGKNKLDVAKIVAIVIKRGADINELSSVAISKVISNRHTKVMKILFENGLTLDDNIDVYGITTNLVGTNQYEMLSLILEYAKLKIALYRSDGYLERAIRKRHNECAKIILEKCDIDLTGDIGSKLLEIAVEDKNYEIIELLVKRGAKAQ